MKKFTIYYKDHLGRNNQSNHYGKDDFEAEKKFQTLYPDCKIIKTE